MRWGRGGSHPRVISELVVDGQRIEVARHGPRASGSPTVVFLHEGLGCVSMWRDFPKRLGERLGLGVLVNSRAGYGRSDAVPLPRPLDYMQREGRETLPALLDACGIEKAFLFGHSDGASIALVHAGTPRAEGRIVGLVLEAPHVFSEPISTESIARTRLAFETGDLRAKLLRHHGDNVDCAFWGWNRAWLDPEFAKWTIEPYVERVTVPTLVIQGEDDEYGTLRQIEAIERLARGRVERVVLPRVGHSPHRDAPEAVLDAVVAFTRSMPEASGHTEDRA